MAKFKVKLSYEGTKFEGWQKQKSGDSIQDFVENALFKIFAKAIPVHGCSRTDAGVHALCQYVHFDINDCGLETFQIVNALNFYLPDEIRAMEGEIVDDDFHARKSAKSKTYIYRISNHETVDPISRRFTYKSNYRLDVSKIKEIIKLFIGKHDFRAFANKNNEGIASYSSVRTIHKFSCDVNNHLLTFRINGDGFLYKMVRNIIGTVLYYSCGKMSKQQILDLFESGDRTKGGPSAPAHGLTLEGVEY